MQHTAYVAGIFLHYMYLSLGIVLTSKHLAITIDVVILGVRLFLLVFAMIFSIFVMTSSCFLVCTFVIFVMLKVCQRFSMMASLVVLICRLSTLPWPNFVAQLWSGTTYLIYKGKNFKCESGALLYVWLYVVSLFQLWKLALHLIRHYWVRKSFWTHSKLFPYIDGAKLFLHLRFLLFSP